MNNALHEPQTVLLLGGTSEIGLAIVQRVLSPSTRRVILACREPDDVQMVLEGLTRPGLQVEAIRFDAADVASHGAVLGSVVEQVGDLDLVVVAFGVLGEQSVYDQDPARAAADVHVNYTGAVSVCLHVAERFRAQGHGQLVVLSSVAGERVRRSNFVYGSSKAALDGFAQGLGDALADSGASVLVVRPGFVHSRMTKGLPAAPFATTPEAVAERTFSAMRQGRRIVWAPGILRFVFMVLRHLPHAVFRRLPLG